MWDPARLSERSESGGTVSPWTRGEVSTCSALAAAGICRMLDPVPGGTTGAEHSMHNHASDVVSPTFSAGMAEVTIQLLTSKDKSDKSLLSYPLSAETLEPLARFVRKFRI